MPLRKDTAGSNPVSSLSSIKLQMSLISQRDREVAVKALEYYSSFVKDETDKMELNALINWIKLEITKNEN
jgi:hypothetical protein